MDSKLYRSKHYGRVGGVCAGIALSYGVSLTFVRLMTLFIVGSYIGIIIYLFAWMLLPKEREDHALPKSLPYDPLRRDSGLGILGGVCAGIANYTKFDVSIIRIITVILIMLPSLNCVAYLWAWFILPKKGEA